MLNFAVNDAIKERKTLFVEVILPLSLSKNYTYRIPYEHNDHIQPGKRVIVQFGKNRIYTALVKTITETPPEHYEAKYIIDVLDDEPIVTDAQLAFWNWIASYYLCNEGEVMNAALPTALKLASETRITLNADDAYDKSILTDKEFLIVDALELQQEISISDIVKLLGQKTVYPLLRSLLEKGIINVAEEVIEKYKPLLKAFIELNPFYDEPEHRKQLFGQLEKAPKQLDALLGYLKLSKEKPEISKAELIEYSGCGPSAMKSLIDKEIFVQASKAVSRLAGVDDEGIASGFVFSESQQAAYTDVKDSFTEKDVVLLHGITSSGKTQLYIKLIEEYLEQGKQVLYLLPEIALTTQIVERIKHYFGNKIGVYHSKFNNNERVEVWNKVLKNEYQLVLGARSSLFLPFRQLGLIVIDEEHEVSYKQIDPAPRYQARDAAIYLAATHHAKVLLGSATPSIESYYNAKAGKYGLVNLNERFGGVQMPQIEVVSILEETQKKTMQSHFTSVLIAEIEKTLNNKEQVILFQNRRGYTPMLICATCGYTPKCIHCDVSLTFHKSTGKLHCHYCGYKENNISSCPACGSVHLEQKGFGTEKIEDELSLIFPDAKIGRLDMDTTRSKNSFSRIITDFEEGRINVLVGTQMVAKGLDFNNVTLIGIINADSMLKFPDFRAFERSYQMLAQVAGRAGRRDKQGKVIIQAYDTEHHIIKQVIEHDYEAMYASEIIERDQFKYPPFYRMIFIEIKHKDIVQLHDCANRLAAILRALFGIRVLGPEAPLVGRIRNYFIQDIIIKAEKTASIQKIKSVLKNTLHEFLADSRNKGLIIQFDIDPY